MSSSSIPVIVLTSNQDDVEFINRILREGGHAAHCQWVPRLDALPAVLEQTDAQLLWLFCDRFSEDIRTVANIKARTSPTLPLIAVNAEYTEQEAAAALSAGAHDLVSQDFKDRICTVAERELRAFQLERALSRSTQSARQYKEQLHAYMQGSDDAIAHVHEGILVEANQAWADLFEMAPGDVIGPLMDRFHSSSHAAMKGAIVASTKGQWTTEPLKVVAITETGSKLPVSLLLESSIFEGEPAIKLNIVRESADDKTPEDLLDQAISSDPATGVYHRKRFIAAVTEKLDAAHSDGIRAVAYIRPDQFGELASNVGPLASEDALVELSELLKELIHANDFCGRFGGNIFTIWLERGAMRDVEAWAENVVRRIADTPFKVGGHELRMTCSIGICEVSPNISDVDTLIRGAESANQRGRQRGGCQTVLEETTEETARIRRFDDAWVQHIKTAFAENRFQLSRLAITSLNASPQTMFDTVLKLIDDDGNEVGASVFIPVAARHNLLRNIDRWVIHKALRMSRDPSCDCIFIRLSSETICDAELTSWLEQVGNQKNAVAGRVCFQVAEETALQYFPETSKLSRKLSRMGYRFAIEHFGMGRDPSRFFSEMTLDYLKIDGSLMQGLANNEEQQTRIAELVEVANNHAVLTIAERVEDANTMAVLFQLGVGYVQGHYVHEPEVVLEDIYETAV